MLITVKSNGNRFDSTIEQRHSYNERRNVSKLYKLRNCALFRNLKRKRMKYRSCAKMIQFTRNHFWYSER